ncbi:ComEC/Rec2 family competence protein [Marimonas lutisalis]|uniref:ComEC/Rec2 family competence protein n=1 Tax=Marimonas lutisalis TaxID=2545756 RepID=UPI0010F7571B|nr:ComEC/Rec2 family competence protein [Marimonas lutisalis]
MALLTRVEEALLAQRGYLFPWVPVCLAVGIGGYFALRIEPPLALLPYLAGGLIVLAAAAWRRPAAWTPLAWGMILVMLGLSLASARAHLVERPVLGWRYYGPVEGRVIGIDRSGSGALRILLDKVVLADLEPSKTPERVRISLHGEAGSAPWAGARVIVTAHLAPPGGPVEPGGFDFQRHAWFLKLGGVGYARTPLLIWAPSGGEKPVFRARMALSQRVQEQLPGETGAFAAAIMTGDRAGIGQNTLEALRASNLAHLLAISGLHMGLLAGFVFAVFRIGFSIVPWVGLRLPAKKLSALMALTVAAGYLALSGGNVATERAFVMVGVALLAVMADRRVISLRAVATAAIVVLILRPEALLSPGFQMSFAATTALVAVFAWLRERDIGLGPAWLRPVTAVVISSAVAGAATAPIGAAHFNQIAHFGLVANLLSVPLMGVLVMPAMVLAAVLMPLGLEAPPLWIVGQGLGWILGVAHRVAEMEGARGAIQSPDWRVLPLMAGGFVLIVLWQGRLRFAGLAPVAAALVLWALTPRPVILIAEEGALVGLASPSGRALSKPRGSGFVALNWLENDGDAADQVTAAARWPEAVLAAPIKLRHVTGARAVESVACRKGDVIVANRAVPDGLDCEVFDPERLRGSGAVAFYPGGTGLPLKMTTAREITGDRLWTGRRKRDQ